VLINRSKALVCFDLLVIIPEGSGVIGMSISTEMRFDRILMTSSIAGVKGLGVKSQELTRAGFSLRP